MADQFGIRDQGEILAGNAGGRGPGAQLGVGGEDRHLGARLGHGFDGLGQNVRGEPETGLGHLTGHVGIYLENGKFIHSASNGKTVTISRLDEDYWRTHYAGGRRVF